MKEKATVDRIVIPSSVFRTDIIENSEYKIKINRSTNTFSVNQKGKPELLVIPRQEIGPLVKMLIEAMHSYDGNDKDILIEIKQLTVQ